MIDAVIKLFATGVAGEVFFDRADSFDDAEAGWADVSVFSFESSAFEWERVARLFAWDAEFGACGSPFGAMWLDFASAATFVCEEVSEFVFERMPNIVFRDVLEFGVHLDEASGPPCPASGGAHAGVPSDPDFACQFREAKGDGLLPAPCGHALVGLIGFPIIRFIWLWLREAAHPCGEAEFQLRERFWHPRWRLGLKAGCLQVWGLVF